MPVIDLADYLGMPQQAPANPVFNQTRKSTGVASLDREIDDFYKGAAAIDQLRSLQRQAPVLQAQQAQLAYDKVAKDARDLRMKQEIEAQVERAANELAGGNLNPESEDFGAKYRDLATRNPLAFSDPRFSNVAGLYAAQNQNYQAARAAQAQEAARQAQEAERIAAASRQYRRDAIAKGVPAADIPPDATDMDIASLVAKVPKVGRGSGSGASAEGSRLKTILDVRKDRVARFENSDVFDDQDPNYIKAVNDLIKSEDDLITFNETGGVPVAAAPAVQPTTQQQVSPAAAAARSALTGMASVATPFSPASLPASAIVSALPTVEAPIQQPTAPSVPDFNAQLSNIPFAQQQQFIQAAQAQEASNKAIAPVWEKAKQDIGRQITKVVPDKAYPGTSVNQLESFAKAVLNPSENIINNPEYGTIPATWEVLQKAGIPIGEMMSNRTVFREPGENRRLLGFLGTQQVGYQELLQEWAKDFLSKRGLVQTNVQNNANVPREEVDKAANFLNKKVPVPQ